MAYLLPQVAFSRSTAKLPVLMAAPTGPRGGGMGQVMEYLTHAPSLWNEFAIQPLPTCGGQGGMRSLPVMLAACLTLCRHRARHGSAILHAHMGERGSVIRKGILILLARTLGMPTLLHLHAAEPDAIAPAHPGPRRAFTRAVFAAATRVLVLGAEARRDVAADFAVPLDKIDILPNGVPSQSPLNRYAGPPRIAFVGNLLPRKGLPDLIAALAAPPLRNQSWSLHVAGGGDTSAATSLARAAGIADRIAFEGWLDRARLSALLARTDVLVLPSRHEALPLVLLEAASFGCAVITCPVGAIADYFTDGETALFVSPGDRAALTGAIFRVVTDDMLRARLGRNARALQIARFDLQTQAQQCATLYRTLAASP